MLTQWEGNALPAYKEILYKSSFANPANKETGLEKFHLQILQKDLFKSSICKSMLILNNNSYSLLSTSVSSWLCAKHSNQYSEEGTVGCRFQMRKARTFPRYTHQGSFTCPMLCPAVTFSKVNSQGPRQEIPIVSQV